MSPSLIRVFLVTTLALLPAGPEMGPGWGMHKEAPRRPTLGQDDFSILTNRGNGTVAPEYKWDLEVRVGPGPVGRVSVWTGYQRVPESTHSSAFSVDPRVLDRLAERFASAGFEQAEADPDPPVGGTSLGLVRIVAGDTMSVTGWLRSPWHRRRANLVKEVESLVPGAVWGELSDRVGVDLRP